MITSKLRHRKLKSIPPDFEKSMLRMMDYMKRLSEQKGENIVTRTIFFTNNDVPIFLKKLDAFEKKSRKSPIMIK